MVNKVILLGRLGKDPEIVDFAEGVKKAAFSLATNEVYYDKKTSEKKEITDWHNVVMWRRQAEVAEKYLNKGDLVYIEGKVRSRSYEDKEGVTKYITEIVVDSFQMLGGKGADGRPSGEGAIQTETVQRREEALQKTSGQPVSKSTDPEPVPYAEQPEDAAEGAEGDDLPF